MFHGLSLSHLIILLLIVLILFGPSRLGDLGTSLGKGIKGFKRAMEELDPLDVTPSKEQTTRIEPTHLDTQDKTVEKEEVKRV
jgi:sec-independent protein translocase protein TatA